MGTSERSEFYCFIHRFLFMFYFGPMSICCFAFVDIWHFNFLFNFWHLPLAIFSGKVLKTYAYSMPGSDQSSRLYRRGVRNQILGNYIGCNYKFLVEVSCNFVIFIGFRRFSCLCTITVNFSTNRFIIYIVKIGEIGVQSRLLHICHNFKFPLILSPYRI